MDFNNTNKYKLVKNPVAQNNLLNSSKNHYPSPFNKTIPRPAPPVHQINQTSKPASQSAFKINNKASSSSTLIESSNKLDDLLRRCREIGKSEPNKEPISQPKPVIKLDVPVIKPIPSTSNRVINTSTKIINSNKIFFVNL
jgi:hypothetical protein